MPADDPQQADYFLGDALGSVRQMADESGAVVYAASYDPYSEVLSTNGDAQTSYGYDGEQTDSYTDLVYLRAREYSPYLNQFIQPDTIVPDPRIPADWNKYLYSRDNPVNYADPSGHYPKKTSVILICGEDMVNACRGKYGWSYQQHGYSGNQQPLTPERQWAEENGLPYYYFGTGENLTSVENAIDQKIDSIYKQNANNRFDIIGFSRGAPFSTGIATDALNSGIPGTSLQVVELDSRINSTNTTEITIHNLINH